MLGNTEAEKEKAASTTVTTQRHTVENIKTTPRRLESIALVRAAAGDLKRQVRKALERAVHFEERIIWGYFSQVDTIYLQ